MRISKSVFGNPTVPSIVSSWTLNRTTVHLLQVLTHSFFPPPSLTSPIQNKSTSRERNYILPNMPTIYGGLTRGPETVFLQESFNERLCSQAFLLVDNASKPEPWAGWWRSPFPFHLLSNPTVLFLHSEDVASCKLCPQLTAVQGLLPLGLGGIA